MSLPIRDAQTLLLLPIAMDLFHGTTETLSCRLKWWAYLPAEIAHVARSSVFLSPFLFLPAMSCATSNRAAVLAIAPSFHLVLLRSTISAGRHYCKKCYSMCLTDIAESNG